jgi:hypothetical protein
VTLNSTTVSALADQSTSGANYAQATGARQPTYNAIDAAYGNQPTLGFATASQQWMSTGTFTTISQPFTIYIVGQASNSSAFQEFLSMTNDGVQFRQNSSNHPEMFAGGSLLAGGSCSSPCLLIGVFNGASSALYINDSQNAVASGVNVGSGAVNRIFMGEHSSGAFWLNGKIAEDFISGSADSGPTRALFAAYVKTRYGIATS